METDYLVFWGGVDYWVVLAAAVANFIFGAIWYSPPVFGKKWMRLTGISDEKMEEMKRAGMGKTYALSFFMSLVIACVIAHMLLWIPVTDFLSAAVVVVSLWIGFSVPMYVSGLLWDRERMSFGLAALHGGYQILSLLIMTATFFILGAA